MSHVASVPLPLPAASLSLACERGAEALRLDRPLDSEQTRSPTDALYSLSGCCNSG